MTLNAKKAIDELPILLSLVNQQDNGLCRQIRYVKVCITQGIYLISEGNDILVCLDLRSYIKMIGTVFSVLFLQKRTMRDLFPAYEY